jgi:hypothetical protein
MQFHGEKNGHPKMPVFNPACYLTELMLFLKIQSDG